MKLQKKNLLAQKRRWRIRKTVRGTAARPRLALKMTHVHLYAQAIDDEKGVTLVSLATTSKDLRGKKLKANVAGAVYRASVAATAALAGGAFLLSFVALRDLAVLAGIAPDLAVMLPLVIDLAVVVSTVALVAVGDKPARRPSSASSAATPLAPAPAATNEAVVLMLNVPDLSPPVPQVSMAFA